MGRFPVGPVTGGWGSALLLHYHVLPATQCLLLGYPPHKVRVRWRGLPGLCALLTGKSLLLAYPAVKELLLLHPLPMPEPACATSAVLPIPHFVGSESLSRNFRHSLAGQSKPSVACDPIYGFACGIQYNTILHILVLNNQDDAPVGYTLCHILNNDSDDTFLFFLQKTMPLPVLLNVLYVLFFVHHSC